MRFLHPVVPGLTAAAQAMSIVPIRHRQNLREMEVLLAAWFHRAAIYHVEAVVVEFGAEFCRLIL